MRILIPILFKLFQFGFNTSTLKAEVFIAQEEALLNGGCVNHVNVKYIGDAGPCTISLYKQEGQRDVLVDNYSDVTSDHSYLEFITSDKYLKSI